MAQQHKIGRVHTTVKGDAGTLRVTYHSTDVVVATEDTIKLDTGGVRDRRGFYTKTTKTRMNQASNQFGLGFSVYQKNGDLFVEYKGKTIEFTTDAIEFKR